MRESKREREREIAVGGTIHSIKKGNHFLLPINRL